LHCDFNIAKTYHIPFDDLQEANSWQGNTTSEGWKSLLVLVMPVKNRPKGFNVTESQGSQVIKQPRFHSKL
jgi:hypothetical protein